MRELAAAASGFSSTVSAFEQDRRQGARDAALVGAQPIDNVVMMEDHDGAYYAWKQAGIHGRILLHIDAHIDWDWILDRDPLELLQAETLREVESLLKERCLWNQSGRQREDLVHIGNYIWPAIRQGIVREFYWLIPDAVTDNPRSLTAFLRMLQPIAGGNPWQLRNIRLENRRIIADVAGVKLTACGLSDLPAIEEGVLLDIDTDFLTAQPTEYLDSEPSGEDGWKQLPWIWPEELIERLREKQVRSDFVTIAYSVEGGFTPPTYKYLGDELALRIKHPTLPQRDQELLGHKRCAAVYRHRHELDRAIAEFEKATALAPADAASHFNLAYLYDEQGVFDLAVACYRQAVQLDPTYGTAYNNFGSLYRSIGLPEHAQKEYERILRWDPQNVEARCGLAETLAQQGGWEKALHEYRTVLTACPDHAAAHRGLGRLCAKRGLWGEAISHLTRATVLQPDDAAAPLRLGDAWFRQRRWDEAIKAYREAMRRGARPVWIYARLGGLYLRKRNFSKAWKHYRTSLAGRAWFGRSFIRNAWGSLLDMVPRGGRRCWP